MRVARLRARLSHEYVWIRGSDPAETWGVQQRTFPTRRSIAAPPSPDARIRAIAARQWDLVTTEQLLAAGLTDGAISRRVARGALQRRHRGVYSLGPAPLSREASWMAATLAAGPVAALSHEAAAELHGVNRFRATSIDVVTPLRRRIAGVRVHTVRRLDPRDLTTHRGIPVTTVHRLIVDLSDVLIAHDLTAVIHEAAFHGRFVEAAVRDCMQRANGRHNLHVVERAIALYRGGSAGLKSRGERTFLALVTRHGLPEPLVNTELHGFEADFHWPERKLVVEVDGGGHARPPAKRADAWRDRVLREAGYEILRFSEAEVLERPDQVLARLALGTVARWRSRSG